MIPISKPRISSREIRAVSRVLKSGNLSGGLQVTEFEKNFSEVLLDSRPAVAVNSGTSGLHLGLLAAGIGPGDEVIVPTFTFAATANAVALTGATPVFCDIDPLTYTIDVAQAAQLVGPKTTGVLPVHMFGHPANMEELLRLAERKNLMVFEDAAQAHMARFKGRMVGTFGKFAMFSLYSTKNMTTGEGGMIACESEATAQAIYLLRNQGMVERYKNEIIGFNNRMTEMQAAIGNVQVGRIVEWTKMRRRNAEYLSKRLVSIHPPFQAPDVDHVFHQFTVRITDDRDGFAEALKREFGVGTGVYYPTPCHRLPSFREFHPRLEMPIAEEAAQQVLSLPVHPGLRRRHLDTIVRAVNKLSRAGA